MSELKLRDLVKFQFNGKFIYGQLVAVKDDSCVLRFSSGEYEICDTKGLILLTEEEKFLWTLQKD